jgi:hypothetical protein
LAVAAGAGIAAVPAWAGSGWRRWGWTVGVCVLLSPVVASTLKEFRLTPEACSEKKYGDVFVVTRQAGLRLRQQLHPGQRLFVWGFNSGLYYYSGSDIPGFWAPFHAVFFDCGQPWCQEFAQRQIADLEANPPNAVVLCGDAPVDGAVAQWLRAHFKGSRSSIGTR